MFATMNRIFAKMKKNPLFLILIFTLLFASNFSCSPSGAEKNSASGSTNSDSSGSLQAVSKKFIDTIEYNKKLQELSNGDTTGLWPAKSPYPLSGAILPYNRIVAFYGNLYSKNMGILGELPKDQMLKKLQQEVEKWKAADTSIPVLPALHYIAVTAQGSPGKDGKHRLRMPFKQIDTIMD